MIFICECPYHEFRHFPNPKSTSDQYWPNSLSHPIAMHLYSFFAVVFIQFHFIVAWNVKWGAESTYNHAQTDSTM